MIRLALIAVMLAASACAHLADTTPAITTDDDCRPALTVGHVPGRMDPVWILRCD